MKCASNAPFSSRSGRIASGITWRRRGGAVLGRPLARVPKVSPEMVGSLLRGNDFGGNPQEGGNNTSMSKDRTLPEGKEGEQHSPRDVHFILISEHDVFSVLALHFAKRRHLDEMRVPNTLSTKRRYLDEMRVPNTLSTKRRYLDEEQGKGTLARG